MYVSIIFSFTQVTLAGPETRTRDTLETFTFDEPIEAERVKITTLSVYSTPNNGYAEIAFFGKQLPCILPLSLCRKFCLLEGLQ